MKSFSYDPSAGIIRIRLELYTKLCGYNLSRNSGTPKSANSISNRTVYVHAVVRNRGSLKYPYIVMRKLFPAEHTQCI